MADAASPAGAAPDVALEEERPARAGGGPIATALAVALPAGAIYWVLGVAEPLGYRAAFLLLASVLIFLLYPASRAPGVLPASRRTTAADVALGLASVVALGWPLVDLARFPYRAASPEPIDLACGALAVLLVLEATRRATGAVLPLTAAAFLLYAYLGPVFELVGLGLVAHRGYYPDRLVGALYMSLEGIFGVPLDVASTYIALFAVYGAVLERGGAGRFFVEWALAASRGRGRDGAGSPAAPGRAVTLASLLLGAVSGSGVATTVTVGSVGWPLLRRAGYAPETAGAILAAGGIGALLSPPTLGAAAFLIAEFLGLTYAEVLAMAVVPALLYYASVLLMIAADARRQGARGAPVGTASAGALLRAGWHHFASLVAIVALLVAGVSAFRAVLWATALAVVLSWRRARGRADDAAPDAPLGMPLGPRALLAALDRAGRALLPVVATTATAGIIVGVVTLTGLGLKIAGVLVALADGSRPLTVLYAAVAVWVLGLAVPVTASYVIAAVMVAPALVQVGVPDYAAHMFVFYYAVLSEVSPPTALAPIAAAALTGGNPTRTMLLTWKYTLPAFLVPLAFTMSPAGVGLLLRAPLGDVLAASLSALAGVAALAAGLGGWIRGAASPVERVLATAAGLLLVAPGAWSDAAGAGLLVAAVVLHGARRRAP